MDRASVGVRAARRGQLPAPKTNTAARRTPSWTTHQLLQRLELRVGLRQERLLVLLLPERDQGTLLVALPQRLGGDLAFSREDDLDLRWADEDRGVSASRARLGKGVVAAEVGERGQVKRPEGRRKGGTYSSLVLLELVPLQLEAVQRSQGAEAVSATRDRRRTGDALEDGPVLRGDLDGAG